MALSNTNTKNMLNQYWFYSWLPRVLMVFILIFAAMIEPVAAIFGAILYSILIYSKKHKGGKRK